MSEWPTARLDDLVDPSRPITYGVVKPGEEQPPDGVRLIRGGDVLNGRIAPQLRTIIPEISEQYRRTLLRGGELVVSLVGNPGAVAVIPPELAGANLARQVGLVALRPSVDARFAMYALMAPEGKNALFAHTKGSVQQVINLADLKRVPVPLPPLPTQRRIASILGAYDDLIEVNRCRIALLEEMARRLFEEWFVHFRFPGHDSLAMAETPEGPLPDGWRRMRFDQLAREVRDGVSPAEVPPETPYVGLEHIPRRSVTLDAWGQADEVVSTKLRFRRGDVLFGKIRPYFHKVAWAPFDGVSSSDAIVFRATAPGWAGLVLAVASSDGFVAHSVQTSNGTKMPRANSSVLAQYPVAVPPTPLLDLLNRTVLDNAAGAAALQAMNQRLAAARDLLLPRLISGELSVAAAERELEAAA